MKEIKISVLNRVKADLIRAKENKIPLSLCVIFYSACSDYIRQNSRNMTTYNLYALYNWRDDFVSDNKPNYMWIRSLFYGNYYWHHHSLKPRLKWVDDRIKEIEKLWY